MSTYRDPTERCENCGEVPEYPHLCVASGESLDRLAELYGIERNNSTDAELRQRIVRQIQPIEITFKNPEDIIRFAVGWYGVVDPDTGAITLVRKS